MRMRGQAHLALMARLAEHKASKQIQRVIRGFLARQVRYPVLRVRCRDDSTRGVGTTHAVIATLLTPCLLSRDSGDPCHST